MAASALKNKSFSFKQLFVFVLLGMLLSASITSTYHIFASSSEKAIKPESFIKAASFIIDKSGSEVRAWNGTDGTLYASGTDASTVINSALSALTSGRTWKEKVLMLGNFSVSSTIVVPSYTILEIQGQITLSDAANVDVIQSATGANNFEIIGGIINANRAGQTGASNGIYLPNPQYGTIRNIKVQNAYDHNIVINNGFRIQLSQLTLLEAGQFNLYFYSGGYCDYIQVSDVIAVGSSRRQVVGGESNVLFASCRWLEVNNIYAEDAGWSGCGGGAGIDFKDSIYVTANNLIAYGNKYGGIELNNVDFSEFSTIVSHLNQADGMSIWNSGYHTTVKGAMLYNNTATGMWIGSSNCITVSDITAMDNSGVGVSERSGIEIENSTDCSIATSTCWDTRGGSAKQQYGIEEIGTSDYNEIYDCRFSGNVVAGVLKVGANTKVKQNYGYVTENSGTATFSGDGSTKIFSIAHGLVTTPTSFWVEGLTADTQRGYVVVPYNAKIADISEADTNKHFLDLQTALGETRKIVTVYLKVSRISGTGTMYFFPNEGTKASERSGGFGVAYIIKDGTQRIQYSQSVAGDDFDMDCMGYVVGNNYIVTANSTHITVTFNGVVLSGTNNIKFAWGAEV